MNNKSWHSLRILNDGRSALREEKNQSVQWNTHFTREMSVDCSRFFDSPQQQQLYNYLYIDLCMIFWFYFTCIKVSPNQTISSRSLAFTLNLTCANDVTCSYDVIMRKRQVLNLTLTLRDPRFSLGPKQFALCQMCSNI